MKIFFVGQNANQGLKDSDPTSIQQIALGQGHQLCVSLVDRPDVVICVDWNKASYNTIKTATKLGIDCVLIKNEPSVVTPGHLSKRIDSFFTRVIEVGRPSEEIVYKWPQTWNLEFFENSKRLERIVAISANKFSLLRGQLYWLRAKAYSNLEDVDLFGQGWDRSFFSNLLRLLKEFQIALTSAPSRLEFSCFTNLAKQPQNFRGPAIDKLETLSQYRVSLVIENSSEFMSEKLIDAILAGTIPVYVGPPVELFGIPNELVVTSAPDLEGIQRATSVALEMNYEKWKSRARLWVNEPEVKESWDGPKCITRILAAAVAVN